MGVLEYQRMTHISKSYTRSLIIQSLLLALLISLFIIARKDDCTFGGHVFILLTLLIKGLVIIPLIIVIMVLVSTRRLSFFQIELLTAVLIIPSIAWHWIIIARFFADKNDCRGKATMLWSMHLLLVVESVWFFIKLWVITIYLAWSVTLYLIKDYSDQRNREKESKRAYEALAKEDKWIIDHQKIDPEEFCIICMEAFDDDNKITQLPCNSKHVYHSQCIAEWVLTNPKCPLCNTDITVS